ncbi:MAG TPA: CvpA family protein [Candidatus Limnocylindrales bacterium]|nr:CvpA family protein [Candidatus Limnocylindrales bacterium]
MADVVMLFFILGFIRVGWSSGLIRRVLGLLYLAVSFVVGAYLRYPAGAIVNQFLPHVPQVYANMIGYTLASTAILLILNLLSRPLMSRVPKVGIARRTDQLLGLLFGGLEAVLILSVAIVIVHTYAADVSSLGSGFVETGIIKDVRTAVDGSTIGQILEKTTVPIVLLILGPLLPKDITTIVPSNIPGGVPFFPKVPVP